MKKSILMLFSLLTASSSFANDTIANINAVAQPHPVGSCYGGGIVFYVNKEPRPGPGHRGLIVALSDANQGQFVWAPYGKITATPTSAKFFTGQTNTTNILSAMPYTGIAADIASQYISLDTCPSCTSWYLPSRDELATLYFQSSNFNNFWSNQSCSATPPSATPYWSSTQYQYPGSMLMGWSVNFGSGLVQNFPYFTSFGVRAIRAF